MTVTAKQVRALRALDDARADYQSDRRIGMAIIALTVVAFGITVSGVLLAFLHEGFIAQYVTGAILTLIGVVTSVSYRFEVQGAAKRLRAAEYEYEDAVIAASQGGK